MSASATTFAGSIPALYDRYLRPMLFAPYAEELAGRMKATDARWVLETAAGTGVLTDALLLAMPDAALTATDLNQPMLDVAAASLDSSRVRFYQADAQALPFPDASFDAIACQFGAMFFPDRIAAYREARRVLRPGGVLLFNVWDRIEKNPVTDVVARAVATLFPDRPPDFFERVPFGYHDMVLIAEELRAAGFTEVEIDTVARRSRIGSAREAAIGLCQGTPLRSEIVERDDKRLEEATEVATAALVNAFGTGPIDAPMSALVIRARR